MKNKVLDFSYINKDDILTLTSNTILIINKNGTVTDITSLIEKHLGYKENEIIDSKIYNYFYDKSLYDELMNKLKKDNKIYDFEIELIHKNNNAVYVLCNGELYKDENNNVIGALLILKDITERKETEIRLKNRNLELEVINKELEAFAYTLSHDLSNSISNIKVASALISKFQADKLDEKSKSLLSDITDTIEHITSTIKGLIDLFILTKKELNIEKINLSNIVEKSLNRLKKTNNNRRTEIYIQKDIEVYADKNMMKVVMENLLSNSWKFTKHNKLTKISFNIEQINDINYFVVKDNGIGFDESITDKLFDPFNSFSDKNSYEGSGIGLSTVKKIIVKHKGDIKAKCINYGKNENERETIFFFALNDDIIHN
ncbi:MAG: PAS domain-containing sensor histidine kinase [Spirochaetota bacterium]